MATAQILIVEDEAIIVMGLSLTLRDFGYEVAAQASSGEEAVRLAEETRPDLVLMDVTLRGGMDGIEAAGRIRGRLDVPVVYLTALTDEDTLRRARKTGPSDYLVKPFDERELRDAIETALRKHREGARPRSEN